MEGGSTALVALFKDDKVIIGNVGDSRAVLGSSGFAKRITSDHRPSFHSEKLRIEGLGGTVTSQMTKEGDLAFLIVI